MLGERAGVVRSFYAAPVSTPESLGDLLREYQQRKALNQTDMASTAGVQQATLSKMQNDLQNLEWETFRRVRDRLGFQPARAQAAYEQTKRIIAARKNKDKRPGTRRNRNESKAQTSRHDAG